MFHFILRAKCLKENAASCYRAERLSVLFNVQISEDMRDELRAEADKALMRQSDFARMLLAKGLRLWRAKRAPKTRRSGGA
jgi:hypothetical protein